MRFFQTLSRRQREMKMARVATLELATRQVKKSQEKSRQSFHVVVLTSTGQKCSKTRATRAARAFWCFQPIILLLFGVSVAVAVVVS